MDVTAARQAEEALRRSESNLAGSAEAHAHRELGLAGSGKRRFASVRGMVRIYGFDPEGGMAGLGRTAAAHSSGGSSHVARGNRSSNR